MDLLNDMKDSFFFSVLIAMIVGSATAALVSALRRAISQLVRRRRPARWSKWRYRVAKIDAELADVAMIRVGMDRTILPEAAAAETSAVMLRISADYQKCLDQLEALQPGDPLEELERDCGRIYGQVIRAVLTP